jgi:hypothetical protein
MTGKSIVVSVFALVLGAAAFAGEEHRMHVELALDDDQTGAQVFRFDSQDAGFNLHDMQVGESRTITGESGETALVVRTEDGFEFDINGKKIQMGDVGAAHGFAIAQSQHHADALINMDEDVHVEHAIKVIKVGSVDSENVVTIIAPNSLDETTQQQIRDVLSTSGHTGEVMFIDTNSAHGDHASMERVHIIKQEVDVTN